MSWLINCNSFKYAKTVNQQFSLTLEIDSEKVSNNNKQIFA